MASDDNPTVCGECAWFCPRTYRCGWESAKPMPPWATLDEHKRHMNPLYDARDCKVRKKITEAPASTAKGDRDEP